jgi:hypothetical protein
MVYRDRIRSVRRGVRRNVYKGGRHALYGGRLLLVCWLLFGAMVLGCGVTRGTLEPVAEECMRPGVDQILVRQRDGRFKEVC